MSASLAGLARGPDGCSAMIGFVGGGHSDVTERVVLQRLRNRALEAVELLAEGEGGIWSVGAEEWINQFFDVIDDDSPWQWRSWSVFTAAEVLLLAEVHDQLREVCRQTPQVLDDDHFIADGWPSRVAVSAQAAASALSARGRFSEDVEETEPGHPNRRPT
jgi:hypothetical protein